MTRVMKIVSLAVLVAVLAASAWAGKKEYATMTFVILKSENGKPVRNAAVVLHPVKKNGDQDLNGVELKTDDEGKASYDGVPYGTMRVQVLAPHFKTYGQDFQVNQPNLSITIKLEPPSGQYSIYK